MLCTLKTDTQHDSFLSELVALKAVWSYQVLPRVVHNCYLRTHQFIYNSCSSWRISVLSRKLCFSTSQQSCNADSPAGTKGSSTSHQRVVSKILAPATLKSDYLHWSWVHSFCPGDRWASSLLSLLISVWQSRLLTFTSAIKTEFSISKNKLKVCFMF